LHGLQALFRVCLFSDPSLQAIDDVCWFEEELILWETLLIDLVMFNSTVLAFTVVTLSGGGVGPPSLNAEFAYTILLLWIFLGDEVEPFKFL